jgi:hypothetical protein
MNEHDVSEQAYRNGYSAGYAAGRRSAGESKSGRWIPRMYDNSYILYHCSECCAPNARERNYCHNCGAKMDLPQITEQTKDAIVKMGEKAHGDGNGYKR